MSTRDRLLCLNQVLSGWRNLTFSRQSVQKSPFSPSYVYELSGGKLILGSSSNGTIFQQPHLNATTGLHVWDLPCRNVAFEAYARDQTQEQDQEDEKRDVLVETQENKQEQEQANHEGDAAPENNKWRNLKLPFAIADFALDVSQNLVIFVERSV